MTNNKEQELTNPESMISEDAKADCPVARFNPDVVQIKAVTEEEVFRRIDAFIRNKRIEVNERNIREFISPISGESEGSCARTEAVYIHREGEKSHISLKKVDNAYGPQTHPSADEDYDHKSYRYMPVDVQRAEAVEERLRNMESHLNVDPESKNVFSRIKALEERIRFLEGISPEYFTKGVPLVKEKCKTESTDESSLAISNFKQQTESLNDINRRISQLKQALKQKAEYMKCFAD